MESDFRIEEHSVGVLPDVSYYCIYFLDEKNPCILVPNTGPQAAKLVDALLKIANTKGAKLECNNG